MGNNPRYSNGTLRRKYRQRFKAMQAPCGICGDRLGAIHYDEPSDSKHPLSFVIDEIIPISRAERHGYASARAAAEDYSNLQAAHYICNQLKGNKENFSLKGNHKAAQKINLLDGEW